MGKGLVSRLWLLCFAVAGFTTELQASDNFEPFTGRVIGNKVRVRLEPSIDSPILDELTPNDMVIVLDEKDGFYGIRPQHESKLTFIAPM